MQTVSVDEFTEASGKFEHDFVSKLKIDDGNVENEYKHNDEEEEEDDFSFVFTNPDGSPITADEAFENGQIRPVFPIFDQNLLFTDDNDGVSGLRSPVRKIFVQRHDDSPSPSPEEESTAAVEGPYCEWAPKAAVKSNSTGSSKMWRLRDGKLRSNSDGKDAFVFLNRPAEKAISGGGERKVEVNKVKAVKGKTTSSASAHEKHYVMNKARKESDKRKSYLPYRQELFGFFANTNGLSRNVHPY